MLVTLDGVTISSSEIVTRVMSGEDIRLIDLNIVRENYKKLQEAFSYADIYTAVKANTSEGILEVLNKEGASFEIATIEELRECIRRGITVEKIIFTHPAKDSVEITEAFESGITNFTSDSEEDLNLIAKHAPGASVMIRIKTANEDKNHDLLTGFNGRFGVENCHAKDLLRQAKALGLKPYGISFHVGTQQEDVDAWDATISKSAMIFTEMAAEGINLEMLDIGGGFPSRYKESIPELSQYGEAIGQAISKHFGEVPPAEIILEPGRAISAMAGITIGRVINVKKHEYDESKNIVTLSVGKFSAGLFNVGNGIAFCKEEEDKLNVIHDESLKQADIYGKVCASLDKPIEGPDIYIPAELASGDIVVFTGTGAYSGEMITNWCSKSIPTTITFDSSPDSSEEYPAIYDMQLEGIREAEEIEIKEVEVRDVGSHWEWLFNSADDIFLDLPPN
jgi:ornithine decarboxylase